MLASPLRSTRLSPRQSPAGAELDFPEIAAPALLAAALFLVVTLAGSGCGPTGVVSTRLAPPSGLTYAVNPAVYTVGIPITPNSPKSTGSPVDSYAVSPQLPAGLGFDTATGVISGTPTSVCALAVYLVTAKNAAGSATAGIRITVNAAPLAPSGLMYSVNPAIYTVGIPIAHNMPRSSGGAVESYEVSPALPAGLILDSTTGIISGTPASAVAAATYTVTAKNAAGSATVGLSITVKEALLPPSGLTYSVNPALYTVGTPIAENSPNSSGGAVDSYGVSPALPAGLSLNTATGSISGTPSAAAAAATYTITAKNAAGSATAGLSITVNSALLPPSGLAYSVNPALYTVGTPISKNTPNSSGGAVDSYEVSPALPAGLSLNTATGSISGTPSATAAAATYTITAKNAAGSATAGLSITVKEALLPPSGLTYSVNPALYTVGAPIADNTPNSSGGVVDSYEVSPALPAGLSLNTATGSISGTPSAAAAAATYTITAKNAAGSATAGLSITVNSALLPPSGLTYSVNPALYTVGTPIAENTPSSSGGAVDSYEVSPALPAGLSLNTATGSISGTPSAAAAAATYTITAKNAAGSATAGLSITVKPALLPPSGLTYSVNPALYTVGTPIAENTPNSGGGAVESYSVFPSLPTGLSINSATGVISGTPTAAVAAATYAVTATNAAGSTIANLAITVNSALLPPSGLAYTVNPAVYTVGTPITPNAPTSSGGAVESYAISPALPAGLSLNSATGVISGTPTATAAAASYSVTAHNASGNATALLSITVQSATPDTAEPTLAALSLDPASVDVTSQAETITFTARITDDVAGFSSGLLAVVSPTGTLSFACEFTRHSGGALDGIYRCSVTIPRHVSPGTWHVAYIQITDAALHSHLYLETELTTLGFPTAFQVATSSPDTTAPTLSAFSVELATSGSQTTVTFTVRAADDLAGIAGLAVVLRAPNGATQTISAFALASGTALDGTFTSTGTLAATAPSGTYHVAGVGISDAMGNSASFLESQLQARGFATTFQIGGP